jgi:hypothetical protein
MITTSQITNEDKPLTLKQFKEVLAEEFETRFDELYLSLGKSFNEIDDRFDKIDKKLEGMDSRIININTARA